MGMVLDYLTPEWLEARLAATKAMHIPKFEEVDRERARPADESITSGAKRRAAQGGDGSADSSEQAEVDPIGTSDEYRLGRLIDRCITICECEYALGSNPEAIREQCRGACESAIPYLRALDFSVKQVRVEDGMSPSAAKKAAETYGGTWWKATGQYAGAEYSVRNQPLLLQTRLELWFIAAVSGNLDLARDVAVLYRADPTVQVDSNSVREGILRCVLAGDAKGEALLASRLEPGYPADFPPQLIELPIAVIERDPATFLEAVRKIGTKFKGKWDLKKHRMWYDERQPKDPARRHPSGSWEECLARTKNMLLAHHWVVSWWAISWLVIAHQRGLSDLLAAKNRKAFSEWVPFSLLDMGSTT
jgi:hypothetical protein